MAFGGACCMWCVKAVKWLPVLFIVAIVVWSYYAYVIQLCIFTIHNLIEQVLYLIFFHASFFIFCWTYWKTIFTEIGRIPKEFYLLQVDVERLEREETEEGQRRILQKVCRSLPVACRTIKGDFRYCDKCKAIKPDRAHHCSVCGLCVLKMDHHCPWINNCVGFTNYKYFVLFLGYGLIYCIFIAVTVLEYFIQFWSGNLGQGKFHILFLFFVSIMFAISLVSLFGYHCYLILQNRTTLESFRSPVFFTGPDKDGFSLGKFCNFLEVFGEFRKFWFLPVFTSNGDGVTYPTRTPQVNSYNSMGATQPPRSGSEIAVFGDGVSFPTRTIDEDTDTLLGNRQRWIEEGETELPVLPKNDRAAPNSYNIDLHA